MPLTRAADRHMRQHSYGVLRPEVPSDDDVRVAASALNAAANNPDGPAAAPVVAEGVPALLVDGSDRAWADRFPVGGVLGEILDTAVSGTTWDLVKTGRSARYASPYLVAHVFFTQQSLPNSWAEAAATWQAGAARVDASLAGVSAAFSLQDVPAVLRVAGRRSAASVRLVTETDRVVQLAVGGNQVLSVAVSPAHTAIDEGLAGRLRSWVLSLDPSPVYAAIDVTSTGGMPDLEYRRLEEQDLRLSMVSDLVGLVVPDIYPWQLLGPDHVRRLAEPDAVSPISGGRWELALAPVSESLVDTPAAVSSQRLEMRAAGRRILGDAIVPLSEMVRLRNSP